MSFHFHLEQAEFEMSVSHPSGDAKWVVGYLAEYRIREVWTRDMNLEFIDNIFKPKYHMLSGI